MTQEACDLSPREAPELDCDDSQIRNLWQAVIKQAKLDLRGAVGHRSKAEREDAAALQAETARWVRGEPCFPYDSTDYFAEVCDLAGVDSTLIREKFLQREEISGLVVEPKYCEACGKSFLRPQGTKQATCASCGGREASPVTTPTLASAVSLGIRYLESDPDSEPTPDKPYLAGDLVRMTCLAANVPNQAEAQRRWPWLGEDVETPCFCKKLIVSNALLVLQHLYETHVQARQDWSDEQLIGWIQKHEQLARAPEQSEPPQDAEQPSTSPTPGFPDAPCVSYEPAMMESAGSHFEVQG